MLEQFQRPYIKQYMTLTSNQYLKGPHPLEIMLNVNNQQGNGRWIMRGKIKTTWNECVWPVLVIVQRTAAPDPNSHRCIIQWRAIRLPHHCKKNIHQNKSANLFQQIPDFHITTTSLDRKGFSDLDKSSQSTHCSSCSFLRFKIGWNKKQTDTFWSFKCFI